MCRKWWPSLHRSRCSHCPSPTYVNPRATLAPPPRFRRLLICMSCGPLHADLSCLYSPRPPKPLHSRHPRDGFQVPGMLHVRLSSTLSRVRPTLICTTNRDQGARSLGGATFTNTTGMTVESCVAFCSAQSFNFAGLEFAQECCACAPLEIGDRMGRADLSCHSFWQGAATKSPTAAPMRPSRTATLRAPEMRTRSAAPEVSAGSSWLAALRMFNFSSVLVLKHNRPSERLLERGRTTAPSHRRPLRRPLGVPGMLQVSFSAHCAFWTSCER